MSKIDYRHRKNKIKIKTTLQSEVKKTVKALIVTLSLMIAVLAIAFLAFTSENAQKGYALQLAKIKNEQLKEQKNLLLSKTTNVSAFSNIEDDGKVKDMTPIETKSYVTAEDNRVK